MGVVTNEINIDKLKHEMVGIEANTAGIMTSVKSISDKQTEDRSQIHFLSDKVQHIITKSKDTITIHEQCVYSAGRSVMGYVRFTVSNDEPSTSDYEIMYLPDVAPERQMRFIAFKEWGATGTASIAINENGRIRVVGSTLAKGSAYSLSFAFIMK